MPGNDNLFQPVDPAPRAESRDEALAENLTELTEMANEIGAQGVWIVRDAIAPLLSFALPDREAPVALDMADGGTIVVLRFVASDGGEPGVETR